ncbi:glycosyltransferase family 4 protein [Cetobacterium ceti]
MHIVYIVPSIETKGGVERVLSKRTNYFIEKFGYKVSIITFKKESLEKTFFNYNKKIKLYSGEQKISEDNNNFLNRILIKVKFFKSNIKKIQKIIDEIQPDIIVSINYNLSSLLKLKTKAIKIKEKHGPRNLDFIEKKQGICKIKKKIKKLELMIYEEKKQKLDKYIILTKVDIKYWKYKENIFVIPNTLTFETEKKSSLENKKIISIGRYEKEKDYNALIDIWNIIEKKNKDWKLDIYGDGSLREILEIKIKKINLKNIHLKEPIKNVKEELLKNSVYVSTSKYEGFGLAILEAMHCGLPIISFDCQSGPRELIRDGKNGYLIPQEDINSYANKLLELMNNFEKRKQMGYESKKRSYDFTEDKIMNMWRELFEEVLSKNKNK